MTDATRGVKPYCLPPTLPYEGFGASANPNRPAPYVDPGKKFLKRDIEESILNDTALSQKDKIGIMTLLRAADTIGDRDFKISLDELSYANSTTGKSYRSTPLFSSVGIAPNPSDGCYVNIIQHHMSRLKPAPQ